MPYIWSMWLTKSFSIWSTFKSSCLVILEPHWQPFIFQRDDYFLQQLSLWRIRGRLFRETTSSLQWLNCAHIKLYYHRHRNRHFNTTFIVEFPCLYVKKVISDGRRSTCYHEIMHKGPLCPSASFQVDKQFESIKLIKIQWIVTNTKVFCYLLLGFYCLYPKTSTVHSWQLYLMYGWDKTDTPWLCFPLTSRYQNVQHHINGEKKSTKNTLSHLNLFYISV